MNAKQAADAPEIKHRVLLVGDLTGKIQAALPQALSNAPGEILIGKSITEIFGSDSEISQWITSSLAKAQTQNEHVEQSRLMNGNNPVRVSLASIKGEGEPARYVLELMPDEADDSANLREGDAIVLREQWHDIKNQVGALKLYATYLTRKMPDGEERQTVEKMLNGINTLIDYIAKIRRGDAQ